MRRLLLPFAMIALAMSALAQTPTPAPINPELCGPFPKIYKEIIYNWMRENLANAESAKIDWTSEPMPAQLDVGGQQIYCWRVNFTVNARNRFGTYTGKQAHGAYLRDGQVIKGIGFNY